jgi:excisionase family DNA binding protein
MSTVIETLSTDPGFIDANAISVLLRRHVKTIYKMARKGTIPSYQIGGVILFDKGEIAKLLTESRRGVR